MGRPRRGRPLLAGLLLALGVALVGDADASPGRPARPTGLLPDVPLGASSHEVVTRRPSLRQAGQAGDAVRMAGDLTVVGEPARVSLLFVAGRLVAVNVYVPGRAFDRLLASLAAAHGVPDAGVDDDAGRPLARTWVRGGTVAFASRCCVDLPGRPRQAAAVLLDAGAYTGGGPDGG